MYVFDSHECAVQKAIIKMYETWTINSTIDIENIQHSFIRLQLNQDRNVG